MATTAGLSTILEAAQVRARALRPRRAELAAAARAAPLVPAWAAAFGGGEVAVIAEVKRRSPSAGAIAEGLVPERQAAAYAAGGARAISVLTEPVHFGGVLADLEAAARAVAVPVLRKDFIVEPEQLYEARAAGASAVLLIVRALARARLGELRALARELGLGCLIEVHRAAELDDALAAAPESVGVNSRDLETFALDVDAALRLVREIPPGIVAVAESGLATRADVERTAAAGADAVLVGTALARAGDPAAAVRGLVGVRRLGRAGGAAW